MADRFAFEPIGAVAARLGLQAPVDSGSPDPQVIEGEFVDPLAEFVNETRQAVELATVNALAEHMVLADDRVAVIQATPVPVVARYTYTPEELIALRDAAALDIVDADSSARGWQILKTLKSTAKRIESWYEADGTGILRRIRQIVELVRDLRAFDAQPVDESIKALNDKLIAWDEAERAREAREAQRLRDEAEAAAKAQRDADAAIVRREAEALAASNAQAAAALQAQATAIAAAPVFVPRVAVESRRPSPKATGGHIQTRWRGIVAGQTEREQFESRAKFLQAVRDGKVDINVAAAAIDFRPKWLNDQAETLTDRMGDVYPGLAAVSNKGTVSR